MESAEREIEKILKKYNCTIEYVLKFPYADPPDDVKLALSVLQKQGMKIVFTLKENK